ncbi:acyltransferase [Rivularia sp. UHCC 0363]|uniref:acyltransferase n=1 Tax=Rivularia sp. UHCC 0363 TaxID=3110244 RepID=UPI002B205225|nr:DapH/DapD/GlmU-related protein [Rivularia sp. UHCC 0363]MEA5594346.1 DapH/DapD/GlmU-related protein [Rivularia sp. UHCC 0363]
MTLRSTILSFFPSAVMVLGFICFLWICYSPGIFSVATFLFCLYGFPLLIHKIHNHFYPIQEGISYLQGKEYSPWWGSHQIQSIYITFDFLEAALRLIPGTFSLWLRLWGAKVGKNVYWTPKLEIADRSLIEIGDNVVFGQSCGILSHAIKPKKQDLMLYVKKVKIGSNVFIGAGSYLAPGVIVQDETFVCADSRLYPNIVIENELQKTRE